MLKIGQKSQFAAPARKGAGPRTLFSGGRQPSDAITLNCLRIATNLIRFSEQREKQVERLVQALAYAQSETLKGVLIAGIENASALPSQAPVSQECLRILKNMNRYVRDLERHLDYEVFLEACQSINSSWISAFPKNHRELLVLMTNYLSFVDNPELTV